MDRRSYRLKERSLDREVHAGLFQLLRSLHRFALSPAQDGLDVVSKIRRLVSVRFAGTPKDSLCSAVGYCIAVCHDLLDRLSISAKGSWPSVVRPLVEGLPRGYLVA